MFLTIHLVVSIPLMAGRFTAINGSWDLFQLNAEESPTLAGDRGPTRVTVETVADLKSRC
jgi:hypothetical protein